MTATYILQKYVIHPSCFNEQEQACICTLKPPPRGRAAWITYIQSILSIILKPEAVPHLCSTIYIKARPNLLNVLMVQAPLFPLAGVNRLKRSAGMVFPQEFGPTLRHMRSRLIAYKAHLDRLDLHHYPATYYSHDESRKG